MKLFIYRAPLLILDHDEWKRWLTTANQDQCAAYRALSAHLSLCVNPYLN